MNSQRRNFPKATVREVLEEQGALCMECGSFLAKGFHQHHRDGDHTNISKDNLVILCPRCHRAKAGETSNLQQYRKVQKQAMEQFDEIIKQSLAEGSKLSASHIREIGVNIKEKLKEAWRYYDFGEYPEPLPADIAKLYDTSQELELLQEYRRGFEDGLKSIRVQENRK